MSKFQNLLLQDIFPGAIVLFQNPKFRGACYDYGVISSISETVFTVEVLTNESIILLETPKSIIQTFTSAFEFIIINPGIILDSQLKVPHAWKQFLLDRSLALTKSNLLG